MPAVVMPDPFRLRVLKAMTASFEAINPSTTEDGQVYYHDMSSAVFRGKLTYGPKDPLPMISILEAPIPQDPWRVNGEYSAAAGVWQLLIQGFVVDDPKHPSDPAHRLMGEVKRRLVWEKQRKRGKDAFGMDNKVFELSIGQGSVRPAELPTDKGFFWLTLDMSIVEDLSDPYA